MQDGFRELEFEATSSVYNSHSLLIIKKIESVVFCGQSLPEILPNYPQKLLITRELVTGATYFDHHMKSRRTEEGELGPGSLR